MRRTPTAIEARGGRGSYVKVERKRERERERERASEREMLCGGKSPKVGI